MLHSEIKLQESQGSELNMESLAIPQSSDVDLDTWVNAFGISDELRKKITEWILKV